MSKKKLAILLIIIVVLAGAIGGTIFFLEQAAGNTPGPSPTSQVSMIDNPYQEYGFAYDLNGASA